jgi:hypothetical protein
MIRTEPARGPQDGTAITWGRSPDPDTDWLAAAALAEAAVARAAPDALVIVTALCWGLDLRALADRPGPMSALRRRKLVRL